MSLPYNYWICSETGWPNFTGPRIWHPTGSITEYHIIRKAQPLSLESWVCYGQKLWWSAPRKKFQNQRYDEAPYLNNDSLYAAWTVVEWGIILTRILFHVTIFNYFDFADLWLSMVIYQRFNWATKQVYSEITWQSILALPEHQMQCVLDLRRSFTASIPKPVCESLQRLEACLTGWQRYHYCR